MFGLKTIGNGLFGGLLDGKPGAFSQYEGGLLGLLGSFNDGQPGNALYGRAAQGVEAAQLPAARPRTELDEAIVGLGMGVGAPGAGQRPMVGGKSVPQAAERREPTFGQGLKRALFPETYAAMDAQRARQAGAERMAALEEVASQVITDPREWMVFQMDPENWAKENASRFAFHDVTGGNTIVNGPGGASVVAPKVEKFDDRMGVTTVENGAPVTQYGEARGPTYSEQTARNQAELDAWYKREKARLERDQHNARVAGGGYGTPGVGMASAGGGTIPDGWVVEGQ